MSVERLQLLSTVFFVLSAVLFLVAIALFFYFDVIRVVGDITGSTARKAIEDIRKGNEISGNKAYKPSPVNKARGKLTDKISPSGQVLQNKNGLGVATGTAKLSTVELASKADQLQVDSNSSNETTLLENVSNETTVLSQSANGTTVLNQACNETTILNQACNETTVLNMEMAPSCSDNNFVTTANQYAFVLDIEMNFAGTDELIE